jgi:catechol 2,3-dioxygenase-like lactoylglutathione lyase family enzyme
MMPCENAEMGFHHVALATRDTEATHRFYTEVMGFELVKAVSAATPAAPGVAAEGYSKHFFYATGQDSSSGDTGMIAFWEIHDDAIGSEFPVDLNAAAGLPWWVNHIAFDAPTREALDAHRVRWQQHGHTVLEVDHDFCVSIYLRDPSGNMVEFCHTTREFTPEDKIHALELLHDPRPALEDALGFTVHHPVEVPTHEPVAGI